MKSIGAQFAISLHDKIKINPLFLFLLLASFIFDFSMQLIIAFCVALLHELAHIIVAAFCGVPINKIEVDAFGISMQLDKMLPKQEIAITLAGPTANLIFAGVFLFIAPLKFLVNFNIAMAALNLIPVYPLDGGRAVRAFFALKYSKIQAIWLSKRINIIFSLILIPLILIFFLKYKLNLLFLLILSFLIFQLFC